MSEMLSDHFSLNEFIDSNVAKKFNINNEPTTEHINNMIYCCEMILEPIRKHFNKPIKVNSSYRCEELNKLVGGSNNSQHLNGQAVDFEISGISNRDLAKYISDNLIYDQLILEFYNGEDDNSGWVHTSIRNDGYNRNQKLIAWKDGKTTKYENVEFF